MLQRERERLRVWGIKAQSLYHRLNATESEEAREARFRAKALNFYEHVYYLLEPLGTFDDSYGLIDEEKKFLTERVAARFFEGLFPRDATPPISGQKNRPDLDLGGYIRGKLPLPLTFPHGITPEQWDVEQKLDDAAGSIYSVLTQDMYQNPMTSRNHISWYLLPPLKNRKGNLFYQPTYHVKGNVQAAVKLYAVRRDFNGARG